MLKSKELFPRKVRELRIRRGKSQEDVAEGINVHAKSISKFENVKPTFSFDILDRLAEELDVLPSYFFNPVDLTKTYLDEEMIDLIHKKLNELDKEDLKKVFKVVMALTS